MTEECPPGLKEVDNPSCRTCKYGKWGGDSEHCLCKKYSWYDYWDSICDSYEEMPPDDIREDISPPNLREHEKVCGTCKHSRMEFDSGLCKCALYFGYFHPWAVCDKYTECDEDPYDVSSQWGSA